MPITLVHLSDIHFGQEKGHVIVIHDDVKARLIDDAAREVKKLGTLADGVIVSGDIAYSGTAVEYRQAGDWLDKLTEAVGCVSTAVQVVPGNHDIDRKKISSGCEMMLAAIAAEGETKLDNFLATEIDRESLYSRFGAYRPFAEAYNCPLDPQGGIASDRSYELAPGRTLRIMGLNSALICSANDLQGRLILGARQRVLPVASGEELVVICHHPLHWLQDSDDARRYIRNRARVFVSGHEHNPRLKIDNVRAGCDLMMLEAGATVPPKAENGFTYTYNILVFDWDSASDALKVKIVPRAWSQELKDFEDDQDRLGGRNPEVVLAGPSYRSATAGKQSDVGGASPIAAVRKPTASSKEQEKGGSMVDERFAQLLLKFFRDLSPSERIAVLVKLRSLPESWREPLTLTIERQVVDGLARSGRLEELVKAVEEIEKEARGDTHG